jgi:ADP-ribose pyrophosphatase YjhB (NUDIX family)
MSGLLSWGRKIQAIAQTGLTYAQDPYDRERYQQLEEVAHALLAAACGASADEVREAFALERGYPTPKVDVRAVVFDDDARLLFVREKSTGLWTLPGGWADVGSSPGEMAARETFEEAGLEVRPEKLLAVYDKARQSHPPSVFYTYKLFFRCRLVGGQPRVNHETAAVAFFPRGALPALDTERITAAQVDRMFAHLERPDLPADFD